MGTGRIKSECKGCLTYTRGESHCELYLIPHLSKTQQCPCLNCIVKGVCIDRCEAFEHYMYLLKNQVFPDLKEEDYHAWRSVNGK